MSEQQPEPVDDAQPEPVELPDGFHEPEDTWSTEQRPGFIESTRPEE